MTSSGSSFPIASNNDNFGADFMHVADGGSVGKTERKHRVLAFLVDTRLALPRKAIYRNMSYQGAEFSEGSLKNYLRELREDGLVERIDARQFAENNVVVSDEDPGYWVATGEGVDHVEALRSKQTGDIDTSHL